MCPANSATSFLDHIFCNGSLIDFICNVNVLYNMGLYDHFPIEFFLKLSNNSNDVNNYSIEESHNTGTAGCYLSILKFKN